MLHYFSERWTSPTSQIHEYVELCEGSLDFWRDQRTLQRGDTQHTWKWGQLGSIFFLVSDTGVMVIKMLCTRQFTNYYSAAELRKGWRLYCCVNCCKVCNYFCIFSYNTIKVFLGDGSANPELSVPKYLLCGCIAGLY